MLPGHGVETTPLRRNWPSLELFFLRISNEPIRLERKCQIGSLGNMEVSSQANFIFPLCIISSRDLAMNMMSNWRNIQINDNEIYINKMSMKKTISWAGPVDQAIGALCS